MKKKINYNSDDLIYGIVVNGSVIAMFMNVVDRDDCLDFLVERYEDCNFSEYNEED